MGRAIGRAAYVTRARARSRSRRALAAGARRVALFVSHAGYNSLSEALYAGTPALFLPLFADQHRNAQLARTRGTAETLEKAEMSGEQLAARVASMLANAR